MNLKWTFLKDSYWYVPTQYLPALQMNANDAVPTQMIDQTVWQITDYKYGYFWGNCAALLYENENPSEQTLSGFRFAGSVTPDGKVHISFMPINELGAAMSTVGTGNMMKDNGEWVFTMQMGSGISDLVVHWANMEQTKEGDSSWEKLPGTDYSVSELLEAAGIASPVATEN